MQTTQALYHWATSLSGAIILRVCLIYLFPLGHFLEVAFLAPFQDFSLSLMFFCNPLPYSEIFKAAFIFISTNVHCYYFVHVNLAQCSVSWCSIRKTTTQDAQFMKSEGFFCLTVSHGAGWVLFHCLWPIVRQLTIMEGNPIPHGQWAKEEPS